MFVEKPLAMPGSANYRDPDPDLLKRKKLKQINTKSLQIQPYLNVTYTHPKKHM